MKPKHTPGPWKNDLNYSDKFGHLVGGHGLAIFSLHRGYEQREIDDANAERIVACVNACEGIADPSVVPEMLAAVGKFRSLFTDKAMGIQFAGSEGAMGALQSVFREIEMAWRKAEVRS